MFEAAGTNRFRRLFLCAASVQNLPPFTLHYDGARCYPLQAAPPPAWVTQP